MMEENGGAWRISCIQNGRIGQEGFGQRTPDPGNKAGDGRSAAERFMCHGRNLVLLSRGKRSDAEKITLPGLHLARAPEWRKSMEM